VKIFLVEKERGSSVYHNHMNQVEEYPTILPFQRNLRSLNYKNSSRMLHIN
jgi:hypothetical protein